MKFRKLTLCVLFSLLYVCLSSLMACPDMPLPGVINPIVDQGGGDPNAAPPPPGSGGKNGGDPVLLSSGEFLFKRTDSITTNTGLAHPFPIVRTYRSKPAPVTKHTGELPAAAGGGGSGTTLYSDACYFRWTEPPADNPNDPYDQEFKYTVTFSIYPNTGYREADLSHLTVMPPEGEWSWTGRAFYFELGTGTTYNVSIVYRRRDPTWWWSQNDNLWIASEPYNTQEIYRWETEFTIPEFPSSQQGQGNNIPTEQDSPVARGAHNNIPSPEWTPGWDMSYNMHLMIYSDTDPNDEVDDRQIHFYSGDGNIHIYKSSTVSDPIYGTGWRSETRDDLLKKTISGFYYIYLKDRQMYMFNLDGSLYGIYKNHQIVTRFHYSEGYGLFHDLKRLDAISDVYGRRTELTYTDATDIFPGNLSTITDWAGRTWTYDYYSDGNIKSVTDPEGFTETYYYTEEGLLEQIEDDNEIVWLDNDYNVERRVYQQTLAGELSTLSYNGSTATSTDAAGVEEVIVLNDDGYALSDTIETETSSVTTSFEYNSKNKPTKITFPEGNGYDLGYDSFNNLDSVSVFSSDPNEPALVYSASYDTSTINRCYLESITDPRNNTTSFTRNSNNLLETITYPEVMTDQGLQTPQVHLTYNSDDLIETITSPDGIVIKYDYFYNDLNDPNSDPNIQGLVQTVTLDYGTDPECQNIDYHFTYGIADANAFPTSDPNLVLTGMRTVTIENPYGHSSTLIYDALNLLRLIEDPDGQRTRLDYNADRKLTKVQNEYGSEWQEFSFGYTVLAKLQTITDSLGRITELAYDERAQVEGVTDANNNTTQKTYNTRRLVKELIDAENSLTSFDYNDNGQLRLITDANDSETEYLYDGYGRLETIRYADDSYEACGYDAASNLTSFRNRADEVIFFGYDALNRLYTKQRPSEPNIVLTYDIAGRVVDITQNTAQLSFDYDRLGRLESVVDQNNRNVGYLHDDMGRREKLEYPDGSYVTYEYDTVGRLQYIKDQNGYKIVEYVHDSLSRTTNILYYRGQSFVGSMSYDFEDKVPANDDNLGNRIARIDYGCYPAHSISYTHDNVGNVTSMDVGGSGGYYGWSYAYDKVYQVTDANQVLSVPWEFDIRYDAVYNRTSWDDNLSGLSMDYQTNALNQYSLIRFMDFLDVPQTYDDRGNCTYYGGSTLAYDCENRLTAADSISYTYDLIGRRLSRTDAVGTTVYVWDGAHIIAEYTNGSLTKKYIYGPGMDNPVAMINVSGQNETWYYYYADALGSIRLLTDASGSVVESYTYLVFGHPYVMVSAGADGNWLTDDGVTTTDISAVGNPYLFTARRWDPAADLYYYRFRDYSPMIGRFLQPDPAGYIDGMNLYAYVNNNPLNWIDPWGLDKNGTMPGAVYNAINAAIAAIEAALSETVDTMLNIGGQIGTSLPERIIIPATGRTPQIDIPLKAIGTALAFGDLVAGDYFENHANYWWNAADYYADQAAENWSNRGPGVGSGNTLLEEWQYYEDNPGSFEDALVGL